VHHDSMLIKVQLSPDQAKVEGSNGTITMTYTRGSRYSFSTPDDGCM